MTESDQDPDAEADEEDGSVAEGDDAGGDVGTLREELLAEVREADEEDLADELAARELQIESLREEIDDLEATVDEQAEEIEDLTSRLKRKQADFQNYKKRVERKREEERQRATEDLVERLLDVRDNLRRALDQDDPADLRDGVESTLRQFETELDRENVAPIEPDPGEGVDPDRHEVLARIESDRPEGTIADVHRPGYEMGEKVLRPAQVAVSDGAETEAADDETPPDEGSDDAAADEPAGGDEATDGSETED